MSKTDIRYWIEECLNESGLSQGSVAETLGIHRTTLNRYFKGKTDVSGNTLFDLIELAGLEIVASGKHKQSIPRRMKMEKRLTYAEVRELVTDLGSGAEMFKKARGAGGGQNWHIHALNRELIIEVPTVSIANDLDRLYVPKTNKPESCSDYSKELIPDARIKLVQLIERKGSVL